MYVCFFALCNNVPLHTIITYDRHLTDLQLREPRPPDPRPYLVHSSTPSNSKSIRFFLTPNSTSHSELKDQSSLPNKENELLQIKDLLRSLHRSRNNDSSLASHLTATLHFNMHSFSRLPDITPHQHHTPNWRNRRPPQPIPPPPQQIHTHKMDGQKNSPSKNTSIQIPPQSQQK